MTNDAFDFQKTFDFLPIETINGIKFTPREIDIMACLFGRSSAKKVASSLDISPKTVENHIRNIMQKLECNSRDQILDFMERSKEASLLKQRYRQLICKAVFEQSLRNVAALTKKNSLTCTIIETSAEKTHTSLVLQLKQNLEQASIRTAIKAVSGFENLDALRKDMDACVSYCRLYVLSETVMKQIQDNPDFGQTFQKRPKGLNTLHLLLSPSMSASKDAKSFFLVLPRNSEELIQYYYSFFEVLKVFFPSVDLEEILPQFRSRCEGKVEASELSFSTKQTPLQPQKMFFQEEPHRLIALVSPILSLIKQWKTPLAFVLLFIFFCSAGFISFKNIQGDKVIHSTLTLPAKFAFLDRPELIKEMDEKLKKQKGIQTIALVGLAGSGKKVLARQYARNQEDSPILWEINAERNETLAGSFRRLAYALSTSNEDKQVLKALQEMQVSQERDDRIVRFVQEKLKSNPNWVLIYYNVDEFSSVEKYFPQDFGWGQGKIIITTTDGNIQNNRHINEVIEVGELTEKQQIDLFVKILNKGSFEQLTEDQRNKIKTFLSQIPSFPLDISIAAYYIKETKTPYKTYVEYLNSYNPEFNQLQIDVLKEVGECEKTRYHIVSLSLQKLTHSNPEYKDLLLFLSVLGSKNIPRDLLYAYKDKIIVDRFIHDLNKYSLTIFTIYDLDQTIPTFSLHRVIHSSILNYLNKNLERSENKKLIFTALEKYTNEIIAKEDSSRIQLMLDHCLKFMNQNEGIIDIVKGRMGLIVGTFYYYMGNFIQAKELLESSLATLSFHPENNYPLLGMCLARLGSIHRELGQYEKAKENLDKGLILYEQHLPNDYIGRALILRHLARVYRNLGNYEKAKSLIEVSLVLYQKSPVASPIQTAHSEAYLGKIYKDLGRYSEAKHFLQKSYKVSLKNYGHDHPRTARIVRDLGHTYYLEGDCVKGEQLTEKALKTLQKYTHPELYTVFENLAEFDIKKSAHASEKGNSREAEIFKTKAQAYLQQALEVVQSNFPADSPQILRIQSKLNRVKAQ